MTPLTGLKLKAVMVDLINKMSSIGGWCGETHIQKTAFFLNGLMGVQLGYDFILYKYGPYSFDLRDDLVAMKANRFLKAEPKYPYGPSFSLGELGNVVIGEFSETLSLYEKQIGFITQELGNKGVVELERISTALLITMEHKNQSGTDNRADRLIEIKPHISLRDAQDAVKTVDELRKKAETQKLILR